MVGLTFLPSTLFQKMQTFFKYHFREVRGEGKGTQGEIGIVTATIRIETVK